MQSLGQACIFSCSIPITLKILFTSYNEFGNTLSLGNISHNNFNSSPKLVLENPYFAFKLYNFIKADNLVNFVQPEYKGFLASFNKASNPSGSFIKFS